jgi:Flp pilus assembly protein TadG
MLRRTRGGRRGTATVELALVLTAVVAPLILGLWEMGRFVQVQQMVSNAAREGARMAAQAVTIKPDGTQIQITTTAATGNPSVKSAVMQYLAGAGLSRVRYEDVDVTFTFLPPVAGDPPLVGTPGTSEPFQGVQNQRFRVTVTITDESSPGVEKPVGSRPLQERILWTTLGIVKPKTIAYQVDWVMLVDRPFTVNATVPGW